VRVHGPADIDTLILKHEVSRVLLAVPSVGKPQRKKILDRVKHLPVHVQTLPSVSELVSGSIGYEQLQEVDLDDLLGREVVPPNEALLSRSITGKVVMVTGAGGSIGSELCRQIINLSPRLLILYENSEFALYSIEKELIGLAATNFEQCYELVAILGSVQDPLRVESVLSQYAVNTIFHAAAYKHVPMVEHNIIEGIRNNIFGTRVVAEAALAHGVERFILISTDKAVRPTNVMGATKRTAEQVIQALAMRSSSTIFSMVRFGNVLGSSGSVVPLFRKQIAEGGPVTVTHREITRYFMSIPEASQLVIQAGAMAQGGDVFVLDMGEPVRIYDLAVNMIELSGFAVLDENNPAGDIAIEFSGLRPGEKLYEELLIGDNVERTAHALIMRANEEHLAEDELNHALSLLTGFIERNDPFAARNLLTGIVKDYHPPSGLVDHLQGGERVEVSPVETRGQVIRISHQLSTVRSPA
jgi:FlaA1/EpsC-like NDP-sugar epimerase